MSVIMFVNFYEIPYEQMDKYNNVCVCTYVCMHDNRMKYKTC